MKRRDFLSLMAGGSILFCSPFPLVAADSTYTAFRKKYAALSSVQFAFSGELLKGSLAARKGGLYHIELGDKTFVCDGHTVWMVQRSTKTVVIDRYTGASSEASLDRIFFVLFNVYVHSETTAVDKKRKRITLKAPSTQAVIAGITAVDIVVRANTVIETIIVHEGSTTQRWSIRDLKVDPKLDDALFRYRPPKDWQQVDLR
jgi:outer membrane lipoprotein-sorting protein